MFLFHTDTDTDTDTDTYSYACRITCAAILSFELQPRSLCCSQRYSMMVRGKVIIFINFILFTRHSRLSNYAAPLILDFWLFYS